MYVQRQAEAAAARAEAADRIMGEEEARMKAAKARAEAEERRVAAEKEVPPSTW